MDSSHSLRSGWFVPCGSAGLGGLAEEEAELLQALGEDVLARHDVGLTDVKDIGGLR
jgi:hypothetical protein